MSTVAVIVTIVVLLAALVCYAFVSQTIKTKKEQKMRLTAALKSRSRNFKFMLNGFPQGFLSKELTLLVQRSLADVCEQLAKLEPEDPAHLQDFQLMSAQMTESHKQSAPQAVKPLESQQQIKDVKVCLEELHKFVFTLEKKNTLTRNQAGSFKTQIKQLVLQVTVDSYSLNGKQASQGGKTKLALHYFDLALKLILREGKSNKFASQVAKLKEQMAQLQSKLSEEEPQTAMSDDQLAEQNEMADEWDKFADKNEDMWRKKNVYD